MRFEFAGVEALGEEAGLGGRKLLGWWNGRFFAGWHTGLGSVVFLVTACGKELKLVIAFGRLREVHGQWFQGTTHDGVVDCSSAKEDGHENNGTWSGVDGEETEEADFGDIDTDHELLESFGVGATLGVDIIGQDIEGVVASCDVDE